MTFKTCSLLLGLASLGLGVNLCLNHLSTDWFLKFAETIKHAHESLKDNNCVVSFYTSLSYSSTSCATPSNSYQSQYNDVSWFPE
jgi:hypothetical protein